MTENLTPREIVAELDRYIVGQGAAKRAVAIALRNRARRLKLGPELRDEVSPKNIIMMGPTGVGKTEIARRMARIVHAPFVKVEATKYTEVGYVGRDVESMVRDLADKGVAMVKEEKSVEVMEPARRRAEDRILDALLPPPAGMSQVVRMVDGRPQSIYDIPPPEGDDTVSSPEQRWLRSREKLRAKLHAGVLEDREIEAEVTPPRPVSMGFFSPMGGDGGMMGGEGDMKSLFESFMPKKPRNTRMTVKQAREVFTAEAVEALLDMDKVKEEALKRVQDAGIIFIDEIDKIAGRETGHGRDVSREGVQRDILPIIEGSVVNTKYGPVSTDHVLFIAAGAFHLSKPGDLIPELQGRFPLRVELEPLTVEDFRSILREPENNLPRQYSALLGTEGVELVFSEDGLDELAASAFEANQQHENIGARRLHTVVEKVLEEISFDAGDGVTGRVVIDAAYVKTRLEGILQAQDLSRFVL